MDLQSGRREIELMNHEDTELRLGLPGTSESSTQSLLISASSTTASAAADITTTTNGKKRAFYEITSTNESATGSSAATNNNVDEVTPPPPKAQVMGWPPIRSYRKNCFQAAAAAKQKVDQKYMIKVSMDGAPYLRKIDLKLYKGYAELLEALEEMFKFKVGEYAESSQGYINGSEFVPTYEDKDGDWMLVGDVPWEMFSNTCKRLRIMKGSDARGLGRCC